jgi:hypothetical protein
VITYTLQIFNRLNPGQNIHPEPLGSASRLPLCVCAGFTFFEAEPKGFFVGGIMRKPHGYWTYEKCAEAVELVKTRGEFKTAYGGAYKSAYTKGWLDRLFADKPRLIFGVGIYDGFRPAAANPLRQWWMSMLVRCYSPNLSAGQASVYAGVAVCPKWHLFSNFERWALTQGDLTGLELDKDILFPGNKIYSPETCCFVTSQLNHLLTGSKRGQRKRLPGVGMQTSGNFMGQLSLGGKHTYLGTYPTEIDAHKAYLKAKAQYIADIADGYPDPRVRAGLLRHVAEYEQKLRLLA